MPTIYDLKPRFQRLIRPAAAGLVARGITANQVTLAGLALSGLGGLLVGLTGAHWAALALLPAILLVRMALNAIDGIMAREHGQQTRLGALLNELTDPAADALLYLPLAFSPHVPGALLVAVVTAGILAEMAGAVAPTVGARRRHDGPFGKSDRAAFFGLFAVLLAALGGGAWVAWALWIGLALSAATVLNRCRKALRENTPGEGE